MYKRLLGLLLFALCWHIDCHAQDILTKTTGEELRVQVVEITPTEVRYKLYSHPEGAMYIALRSEVFMIHYATGMKEVFTTGAAPRSTYTAPTPGGVVVPGDLPGVADGVRLSGPRLGATVLTGGVRRKASDELSLNPFLTQFGWQFETRLFRMTNGTAGLLELVPLVGGLEQGKFIPSVNALLGVRGPKGFEFGLGPNLTPVSAGITLAVGTTVQTDSGINFPINLAVVPGNGGARISLLIGFTTRRD